jgi:energy-coupling factor transporter ATP-binding protein EcfA2
MPAPKLESIELDVFRGATKPLVINFDPERHITMIFGENGCGKSTIVDGFGFVGRRDFGSLTDHPGVDENFVTSLGGDSTKTRVKLKTAAGSWEATLGKKKVITVVPDKGCPRMEILRRKQILDLVDAQPKKRFEELSRYINVEGVAASEQGLRDAVRDVGSDLDAEIRVKTASEQHLTEFWEQEGKHGASALIWAKAEAGKNQTQLTGIIATANAIATAVADVTAKLGEWDAYVSRCTAAKSVHTNADAAFQKVAAKATAQSAELIKVLREAKTFLSKNNTASACPVCTSPITAATLSLDIDKRISAMNELDTALRAAETAKRNLAILESQRAGEVGKITRVIATAAKTICDADFAALGIALSEKQQWQDLQTVPQDEDRIQKLPSVTKGFASALAAIVKAGADAQKIANQQTAISGHVKQVENSTKKVDALDTLKRRLAELLSVVEVERKAFVSDVLTAISGDVEALYNRVHPGESVGGVKLTLDTRFIGSLHLHADFHSAKGITPQSVFSESHLDTLGLCVFLALAKRYSVEGSIIILDDVLTSIDASHLDRIITVLHEEAKHFSHSIITTHYRPWRDRYRFHRAPTEDIAFVELRTWSLDGGIRLFKSQSSLADLKAVLAAPAFDRQGAASKAGQLLENLLDFLARRYQCRLPLTGQPHYTLGDLVDCFSKDLRKVLRAERLDKAQDVASAPAGAWVSTPIPPIIDRLKALGIVRNHVGAHYNALGSDCTDAEIETFAKTVVELAEVLVCPQGGDLPDRSKTGSFHHSKSGHVRLFPLEEPA